MVKKSTSGARFALSACHDKYGGYKDSSKKGKFRSLGGEYNWVPYFRSYTTKTQANSVANKIRSDYMANHVRVFPSAFGAEVWIND